MIRYTLRCEGGHEHEAWFRSSADFEVQARDGLIECATCGTRAVGRGLMAPALVGHATAPTAAPAVPPAATPTPSDAKPRVPAPERAVAGAAIPAAMRALLSRMRSDIERQCENVGRDFALEARRMHRGESDKRGIYGEASQADREALAEEGVDVGHIPWLPRSDS